MSALGQFPEIQLPRGAGGGTYRLAVVNNNVPNMVGQISADLAAAGLNIIDMLNAPGVTSP